MNCGFHNLPVNGWSPSGTPTQLGSLSEHGGQAPSPLRHKFWV